MKIIDKTLPQPSRIGCEFPLRIKCNNCGSLLEVEYEDIKYADVGDACAADYFYILCPVCKHKESNVNTQIDDMLSVETRNYFLNKKWERGQNLGYIALVACVIVLLITAFIGCNAG